MGFLGRLLYSVQAVIAIAVFGIVFAQVAMPIINMGQERGGPFTSILTDMETLVPPLIGALFLFVIIWLIISGAQQERTRDQQNRRPPL